MKATITRHWFTDKSTIGMLDLDGLFFCYTLEDVPPERIPAGTYKVKMVWSNRFRRVLPRLQDVPGRTAILWHDGNTSHDTTGCTLVGKTRSRDFIGNSDAALDELIAKLPAEFEVTYVDEPEIARSA